MPPLTPEELQEARRRSGKLGGRPRKPTRAEAREAALEELVPKRLRALAAHLGEDGNPDAWRAALRLLEFAWGSPREQVALELENAVPQSVEELKALPWQEKQRLLAELLKREDLRAA